MGHERFLSLLLPPPVPELSFVACPGVCWVGIVYELGVYIVDSESFGFRSLGFRLLAPNPVTVGR